MQVQVDTALQQAHDANAKLQQYEQQLQMQAAALAQAHQQRQQYRSELVAANNSISQLQTAQAQDAQATALKARQTAEAHTAELTAARQQYVSVCTALQRLCTAITAATAADDNSVAAIEQACEHQQADVQPVQTVKTIVASAVHAAQIHTQHTADTRYMPVKQQLDALVSDQAATAKATAVTQAHQETLIAQEILRLNAHSAQLRQQLGEHCHEPSFTALHADICLSNAAS